MKKVFFAHVGKTAGSSFNQFLKRNFIGEEHCEKYLTNKDELVNINYLRTLDYVSGHLKISVFAKNFNKSNYFSLSFLRHPVNHLFSSLNWVMRIYDVSPNFFSSHPKNIQNICIELRNSNLNDTSIFIEKLNKFQGVFRNNQSRYFIDDPHTMTSSSVIKNMHNLDMVGITEFYEESLEYFITQNKLKVDKSIDTANKNPKYLVDKDILNRKVVEEFILNYQSLDMEVYNYFYNNSPFLDKNKRQQREKLLG